jgi:ATP-dependent RNA helicase HelY
VGEFAAWLANREGGKTFYTAPIKALSNQKFGDFAAVYGPDEVGLLTGDNSINGNAGICVMTTEVLRNMIYEDSETLHGLRYVVLDEVHYLQDRYRGAVWEEVLIHLPVDVQIVSLSATVSNAEEFGEWLQTLRGRTEVIIEERRPVDLEQWYMASSELIPMFIARGDEVVPNPRGREFDLRKRSQGSHRPKRGGKRPPMRRVRIPFRTDVVDMLWAEKMLPAIYFIFSRKGCDEAVRQCLREGIRLTSAEERAEIFEYAQARTADLDPTELDIMGYADWISGLERGIAAHHAGMIPPFKEVVEELFARGLVKVVFATETLALGINMPARSVVIESLMKFNGEKHELMTPGAFTQLSGRAGRRGKDEIGHAVVLLQRFTRFDEITRLASTRTYPLRSSFQPSYNMAVNLVRNYTLEEAEHLVNSSFAQFQSDRSVVRLERSRERNEAYLASYRERLTCELGDFEEYRDLKIKLQKLEGATSSSRSRTKKVKDSFSTLSPGDVIDVRAGKRRGRYAVIEVVQRRSEKKPRILALARNGSLVRFGPADLVEPPRRLGSLAMSDRHKMGHAPERREVAEKLRAFNEPDEPQEAEESPDLEEIKTLRRAVANHPVSACPEIGRHMHFAERAVRLERDLASVERQINRTTGTLARRFDQVLGVLESMDYVAEWKLTTKGETLTGIYNESDLLVVEIVERGLLDPLDSAEIAAICSTLVYETRGPEGPPPPDLPTAETKQVWRALMRVWREIRAEEEGRRLDLTREPDAGFARRAYDWARGEPLDKVLGDEDAPGDFVRSVKQLLDLLRQLDQIVVSEALRSKLQEATHQLSRGVIAYTSLEL